MSRGAFGVGLPTFLGLSDNFTGGYSSGNNSNEVTIREMFNLIMGGSGGINSTSFPGGLPEVLKSNVKANAFQMATAAIVTPIAFKVGKQLLAKPIIRPMNKVIKMAGLKDVRV